MAAEYLANAVQEVALNSPVIFTASIPCTRGYVYHEDETGVFILKGITKGQCFATYQITFNGNIAVPTGGTGGTAGPIALAINVNGAQRPTSKAIFTPAAAGTYGNVTSTAIVKVPRGCCFNVSVNSVPALIDAADTPAPVIEVQNANLVVDRIA